jgi:tRNA/rRNA methyltransferase
MERRDTLPAVRVVLSRTSHPGNIGAAARAMKTMGFSDLALVRPRHFPDPDATAMAAGAAAELARASVHDTLEGALAGCVLAVGFSARRRDLSHPVLALRDAVPVILDAARAGRVALVFGNETSGLSNEELARCQAFASIPANPAYSSLNLAAAVQVACYEVAVGAGAHEAPRGRKRPAATLGDIDGFFAHLERSALASGFLDPRRPGRFIEHMRRLFARAGLERPEVKLLRGLLGAMDAKAGPTEPAAPRASPRSPRAMSTRAAPSRKRSPPRPRKRT